MSRIATTALVLFTLARTVGAVENPVLGTLPRDFTVHAVGTYAGAVPVNVRLDDSGHETKQIEVVVNKPKETVLLVLTAYEPVVWRVGRTRETKIAGILVSGYHGQALIGVDKKTPHALSSYENGGSFEYFFADGACPELLQMDKAIHRLVGREIHRFHYRPRKGVFTIGKSPASEEEVLYSSDLAIQDYAIRHPKAVGQRGLNRLVAEGKLRLATQEDIEAWVDKASEKYKRFNPDLSVEASMRVGTTYVVLEKLTLPNGLYGAHSRDFIIPVGMDFPDGPRCHNSFFRMDGSVVGPKGDW
ncbi:MAG: hypothetical protein ACYS47_00730 [Planctomycetota bacterium]